MAGDSAQFGDGEPAPLLRVEVTDCRPADVVAVTPVGVLDFHTAPSFDAEVLRVSAMPASMIVVLLDRVTFVDSSGLRALVRARRHLAGSGQRFQLAAPSPLLAHRLRQTGLDSVLGIIEQPFR